MSKKPAPKPGQEVKGPGTIRWVVGNVVKGVLTDLGNATAKKKGKS